MKMANDIKNFLRNFSPASWSTRSYAQEGEDLALLRLLGDVRTGFYVEVGCHHPFRFSNTYLFYKKGWRGICLDPLPGTAKLFNRWRPRDIALEVGVSSKPSFLTYYMFNEPALNTFDVKLAKERDGLRSYRIVREISIRTERMDSIIERHLPVSVRDIDFFSIDVEGLDLDVLHSNDWHRFNPKAVVAECLDGGTFAIHGDPITNYLCEFGYAPYAKTGHSVIFVRE